MGRLQSWVRQYWPSLAAILLLWIEVAHVLATSLRMNQGHLVYALDDSYILMAMARNLARHGVWGMTPFQFSASSSGPLWTLLVACVYRAFGVNTFTPLILNLLLATLLVFAVRWILASICPALPNLYVLAVLLGVLFFSPVVNLIFLGLEHLLHMLATLLFVFYAGRILADKSPPAPASRLTLIALGAATSAVRYEGLFAVAVVAALLLLVRRRVRLAVELALWSALPAFILGVVSVGQGWFWLPNSVLLKGNLPLGEAHALGLFLARIVTNTAGSGMRVVYLEAMSLLLILWHYGEHHKSISLGPQKVAPGPPSGPAACPAVAGHQQSHSLPMWMMGIFAAVATLHLALAASNWFYRYEAYLVALGITVVAAPLWEFVRNLHWPHRFHAGDAAAVVALGLLILSANLFWRIGRLTLQLTPLAMHDTFRWHYQMGKFVQKYYQGDSLAVNDIGAADYMADIHLTDPHGLADREIGRIRLKNGGKLKPELLDAIARSRGVSVALVDENWVQFFGGFSPSAIPSTWLLAGTWRYQHRVVLVPTGLSFYALNEAAKARLMENLRQFAPLLPPDVEQVGPYTEMKAGSRRQ